MSWQKLTQKAARRLGAGSAEDVIQVICRDCADGNLAFDDSKPYCPIQVNYGWDGEHESIRYNAETDELRCDHWREEGACST